MNETEYVEYCPAIVCMARDEKGFPTAVRFSATLFMGVEEAKERYGSGFLGLAYCEGQTFAVSGKGENVRLKVAV